MKIDINNDYRITSDSHQWIVQKRRIRKGNQDWESVAFLASLPTALEWLRERLVREGEAETLTDALGEIETVTTTLSRALAAQSDALGAIFGRSFQ